ncbi:UNVERIFIED_CONTAM: hypothetical protein Sradi_6204000 [Sesamum radiatum]|uniref:GAG-pre-integrase domain-containing protein n=1 Tax=Sesamum radiatum TaxID=300843 RepID=A0AAW2K931_SESRA
MAAKLTGTGGTAANEQTQLDMDFLQLQGGEHSGMIIVTAPMDGMNYMTWSRSVKLALRARTKLCFIEDSYDKPNKEDKNYGRWIKVDSMVQTWILSLISKDIVGAFLYAKTSRELWLDLEKCYGQCNDPLLYKLQREIASVSQGSQSVVNYFTRLKMLWDELACVMPTHGCSCGLCICGYGKLNAEAHTLNQLMQFFMGLNDEYDHLRDQILEMKPLPSVNKAYSMVLRVERQRQIHSETSETTEGLVLNVKGLTKELTTMIWGTKEATGEMQLTRNLSSVTIVINLGTLKKHVSKSTVSPTGIRAVGEETNTASPTFSEAVRQELMKLMKGKMPHDPLQALLVHDDFAGIGCALVNSENNDLDFWIVDTGATNHMCAKLSMLSKHSSLSQPTHIFLPDGTSQPVHLLGMAVLHNNLILTNDLKSNKTIGVERQLDSLYVIDRSSFNSSFIQQYSVPKPPRHLCNLSASGTSSLWHKRLGHPSFTVLKHIVPLHASETLEHCDICPLSKQERLPFHPCGIRSNACFELIHLDFFEDIFPYKHATSSENVIPLPVPTANLPVSPVDTSHTHTSAESIIPPSNVTESTSSDTHLDPLSTSQIPSRKSQRSTTKPTWLQDYICNHTNVSLLSCPPSVFSSAHRSFMANVATHQEPRSFFQANQDENWRKAMQEELAAFERNHTWELASLPPEK